MSKLDMSIIGKRAYYTLRGLDSWQADEEEFLEDEVVEIIGYTQYTIKANDPNRRKVAIIRCEDRKMDDYVNDILDGDNGVFFAYVSQLDIIEEE